MLEENDKLGWQAELTTGTLALFVRSWLVNNAPLPDAAMAAAQTTGKERWERFG